MLDLLTSILRSGNRMRQRDIVWSGMTPTWQEIDYILVETTLELSQRNEKSIRALLELLDWRLLNTAEQIWKRDNLSNAR